MWLALIATIGCGEGKETRPTTGGGAAPVASKTTDAPPPKPAEMVVTAPTTWKRAVAPDPAVKACVVATSVPLKPPAVADQVWVEGPFVFLLAQRNPDAVMSETSHLVAFDLETAEVLWTTSLGCSNCRLLHL